MKMINNILRSLWLMSLFVGTGAVAADCIFMEPSETATIIVLLALMLGLLAAIVLEE